MNPAAMLITPTLSRLVLAAALLTSGWVQCFVFVPIASDRAAALHELGVEVRHEVVEETAGEQEVAATGQPTVRGVQRARWLLNDRWPQLGSWGTILAWSAGVAELLAGLLLFVGLFTRLAAALACLMTGSALYLVSIRLHGMFETNPFDWPLEPHRYLQLFAGFALLTLAIGLLFSGPGPLAIDRRWSGDRSALPPANE